MDHSIIIPHRNRIANLADCLASIERSAKFGRETALGGDDFEVIVVDNGTDDRDALVAVCDRFEFVVLSLASTPAVDDMPIFNKPQLLNDGIKWSSGRFVTFLDADAIVGPLFLSAARTAKHFTRLCYRVRYVPADYPRTPRDYADAFEQYDNWPRGFEAYGTVDRNPQADQNPAAWSPAERFGNSQFTIERRKLRGLWYDERYAGRRFSDLDFMRRIGRQFGADYTAGILTHYQCAMIHRRHEYGDDWTTPEITKANKERYKTDAII